MNLHPNLNFRVGMLCVSLLATPWATAQTPIGKCGGSTTFNGTAKVAFLNLERDTDVSIQLHSTIKGHAASSTVKASRWTAKPAAKPAKVEQAVRTCCSPALAWA